MSLPPMKLILPLTLVMGIFLPRAQARGHDPGLLVRPFALTLPEALPGGWQIKGTDETSRSSTWEGAFYLPDLAFRIDGESKWHQKRPGGLWAFLESFVKASSRGDFDAVLGMYTESGRVTMKAMLADPSLREQWETIHRALTWIEPRMVIRLDEAAWSVVCKLAGPPWAAANYRVVWSGEADAWRFEPKPFDQQLTVVAELVKANGPELLNPRYVEAARGASGGERGRRDTNEGDQGAPGRSNVPKRKQADSVK